MEDCRADHRWYVRCFLSRKALRKRILAEHSDEACYFSQAGRYQGRINTLNPDRGSLMRFQRVFLPQLRRFLLESSLPAAPMTFVYGDTHEGGWARIERENITVYNTGAWVVHGAQHHPPYHLFVVPASGEAFLFDVSFQNELLSNGDSLLRYEERDVEARKRRVESSMPALAAAAVRLVEHEWNQLAAALINLCEAATVP